jgi:hypothetical protein
MRIMNALLATMIAIGGPLQAQAYDWNGKTIMQVTDFGNMQVSSGHPLATYRAFQIVAHEAKKRAEKGDTELRDALLLVYGEANLEDFANKNGYAFQTTVFGNWLNEVNTNVDLEGNFLMSTAAGFLAARYTGETTTDMSVKIGKHEHNEYGDLTEAQMHGDHSVVWDAATGYSSTNFRHSMMVTSKDAYHPITQDQTFDRITEHYAYHSISVAIQGLLDTVVAETENAELQQSKTFWGRMTDLRKKLGSSVFVSDRNRHKSNFRYIDALSNLGGVFHLVQDSSVACTDKMKLIIPDCIEGDGHGIVRNIGGRYQVVALADDEVYQARKDFHGKLDNVYRPENIEKVFGSFDPAIAGAHILREVALSVYRQHKEWNKNPSNRIKAVNSDGSMTDEFVRATYEATKIAAKKINNGYVRIRYAEKKDRILPPKLSDLQAK